MSPLLTMGNHRSMSPTLAQAPTSQKPQECCLSVQMLIGHLLRIPPGLKRIVILPLHTRILHTLYTFSVSTQTHTHTHKQPSFTSQLFTLVYHYPVLDSSSGPIHTNDDHSKTPPRTRPTRRPHLAAPPLSPASLPNLYALVCQRTCSTTRG